MESREIASRKKDWESIALPIILMITGAILLGGNYIGILSLDRIQNFWPMALVLTGLTELMPVGGEN